jgi:hypothetical protein
MITLMAEVRRVRGYTWVNTERLNLDIKRKSAPLIYGIPTTPVHMDGLSLCQNTVTFLK